MTRTSETILKVAGQDPTIRAIARARLEELTMPYWALGRLMDLAVDLAGMTARVKPPLERKTVVVMAADHGVVVEGVSRYPQEVTTQMVRNFASGGASINALARRAGANVVVVNMGIAGNVQDLVRDGKVLDRSIRNGCSNIAVEPAMTREEAELAIERGIDVVRALANTTDVFAVGEMGIGNTTPSSAIIAAMTGMPVERVVGRGTGIDDEQLTIKIGVVKRAMMANRPDANDPFDVLTKVGGFEIGGIAGAILGAAAMGKPVLVDGFISTAAAMIAFGLAPKVADYLIASHRSAELGHAIALEFLGKRPLLDLDLRLGEGTGAALAMGLVDAAGAVLSDVATFSEAAVTTVRGASTTARVHSPDVSEP